MKQLEDLIFYFQKKHDWTTGDLTLAKFKKYMEDQGNPQKNLRCIHISGTNGKGSTSKALALMLESAGYKVATFNSPSILEHVDQIQINGKSISQREYVQIVQSHFHELDAYDLSLFEVDVFVSILYFLEQHVDFAIYEVGMGGLEDATNVIDSILSIITNIGLDHCSFLGDTYEKIAYTKGGIIKENSLFLTAETKKECMDVFDLICKEKNTKRKVYYPPFHIQVDSNLHFDTDLYQNVQVSSISSYQAYNVSLAMSAMVALWEEGYIQFQEENIRSALKNFSWIGRFERIQENPLILLDGAHNKEGIDALVEACEPFDSLHVIFSALRDKPYDYMLDRLEEIAQDITVCDFDYFRAEKKENLAKNRDVIMASNFIEALKRNEGNDVLICGSLYFIQQVRKYLMNKEL